MFGTSTRAARLRLFTEAIMQIHACFCFIIGHAEAEEITMYKAFEQQQHTHYDLASESSAVQNKLSAIFYETLLFFP